MSAHILDMPPASPRRRGRLMLIPLTLLCAMALGLGYLFLNVKPEPSIPLGASAVLPGGMARVNGLVPLEIDGWLPPEQAPALSGSPADGTHRVRVLVQFTALEGAGIVLEADAFAVTGLGGGKQRPLWSSFSVAQVRQGESFEATMVFELQNTAIALVLEGPGDARLSLGLVHHTS